jgi:uncharacterized protein (DUF58 family)
MIRLRTRLIPFVVGFLAIALLLDPYRGWAFLLIGFGGAWLIGYLWVRSLANQLMLKREMRFGWAQVGDRLEERFTLDNRSWLPALWVEIQDRSTLPDYQASRVTGVSGLSTSRWHTAGICTRRGLYTHGPTSLLTGDPLGLYTLEIRDPSTATLLVLPPVLPLPTIEIALGGRLGEGRPRPNAPEPTVSSYGTRAYSPGDSLRWIHWRTTARRDDLYVRLFDNLPSSDWWIILDMDQAVQAGEGETSTDELGVILAASLADRGVRLRHSVGLVANGQELIWLPPLEGEERRWEILRALALLNRGDRPLGTMLSRIRPALRQRISLILITPSLDPGWLEALLPLTWRGAVPTVLLLDPSTFGSDGDPLPMMAALSRFGIPHYRIPRDLLDRPEAQPGTEGRWEWRVTPMGRAVPIRRPRDLEWKVLP